MSDLISTGIELTGELAKLSESDIQPKLDQLREATEDFEAIFLHQLLKIMRQAAPKSDLFEQSFAKGVYEDMMDEQLAKEMASSGSFGIADLLYEDTKDLVIADAINEYTQSKAEQE